MAGYSVGILVSSNQLHVQNKTKMKFITSNVRCNAANTAGMCTNSRELVLIDDGKECLEAGTDVLEQSNPKQHSIDDLMNL